MAVQFQMHIPDPEDVPKVGGPLVIGMDFHGMTAEQASVAVMTLRRTADRIEQTMEERRDEEVRDRGDSPGARPG